MGDIIFREATLDDAEGIGTVHALSWRETYVGLMPQEFLDSIKVEDRIELRKKILRNLPPGNKVWVAETNQGEIIGFVGGGKPREDRGFDCELYAIYLLKKYQGSGIGKTLFKTFKEHYKRNGCKNMYLWVLDGSPTCKFYDSAGGFQTDIKKSDIVFGTKVNEALYSFSIE